MRSACIFLDSKINIFWKQKCFWSLSYAFFNISIFNPPTTLRIEDLQGKVQINRSGLRYSKAFEYLLETKLTILCLVNLFGVILLDLSEPFDIYKNWKDFRQQWCKVGSAYRWTCRLVSLKVLHLGPLI